MAGLFIADALAMPVHWYYNPADIRRGFGAIRGYEAPKDKHPSSIMSLSNTGGHGRGGQGGKIIGDVINHGKHRFWGVPGTHYHQGMKAGENTLNALCARVVVRGIAALSRYDPGRFLQDYVAFMTTPGTHNDTYAESFHRDFFKNWAAGVPPEHCSRGTEGHNTAQIGGFVMLPPVVMSALSQGRHEMTQMAMKHLALTHDSRELARYSKLYVSLLADVAQGQDLRSAVESCAAASDIDLQRLLRSGKDDVQIVHGVLGPACYITSSFPTVLFLAHRHADSFEGAVLANTNVGGENCHRGAALGALMGAAHGESGIPAQLKEGLHDHGAILKEIDAFVKALSTPSTDSTCSA